MRRRSHLIAAVLALSLVVAGCGGDGGSAADGGDGDGGSDGRPSTEPVDGASDDLTEGAPDPPRGADGTGGAPGSLGPAFEEGDEDAPPRPDDVPLEGRYRYQRREGGGEPAEWFFDAVDLARGREWLRQLHTWGAGTTATRQVVVWLDDQVYHEAEQRAHETEVTPLCVWDPGLVELRLPLREGASWTADSTCTLERASRRRTVEARVTGTERVRVGGAPVEVFVIARTVTTTTTTETPPVTVAEIVTTTDLVSADRRLLVRSTGTRENAISGVPHSKIEFTMDLVSLEPVPPSR